MHNRWHPDLEPAFRVKPGAELRLECQDGIAGQLGPDSTHDDVSLLDLGLAHPLTGPVFVEGADPGDTLCVDFLAYEPDSFGATPIVPGFGFLADLFPAPYLVKWRMAGGRAISDELPGVAVPGDPFAGVVGVAPSRERMEEFRAREERIRTAGGPVADAMPETAIPSEAADGLRTIPPREIGGNVDIRQLVAGSTLFLPVDVPGALFSIGDLHFAQGDGEVCGTAIEMRGAVTVRFRLQHSSIRFPQYRTPPRPGREHFATTGIATGEAMDIGGAARLALLEMIGYLEREHGFEPPAAYALCSAAVDLRISELVDVPYPLVSALLPLDIFAA